MVVPVLITSCHVSLNPNSGPVTAQTRIRATAMANVTGRPVTRAVHLAKRVNPEVDFAGRMTHLRPQKSVSREHLNCMAAEGFRQEATRAGASFCRLLVSSRP